MTSTTVHSAEPWELSRVPNASLAPAVEELDAGDLTVASFRENYVDRCRPVLIKQACSR